METPQSSSSIGNDVLHNDSHSKLSPEEIAKALAHHNRHHGGGAQNVSVKPAGKKHK
jgi:hypothetical protein